MEIYWLIALKGKLKIKWNPLDKKINRNEHAWPTSGLSFDVKLSYEWCLPPSGNKINASSRLITVFPFEYPFGGLLYDLLLVCVKGFSDNLVSELVAVNGRGNVNGKCSMVFSIEDDFVACIVLSSANFSDWWGCCCCCSLSGFGPIFSDVPSSSLDISVVPLLLRSSSESTRAIVNGCVNFRLFSIFCRPYWKSKRKINGFKN